MSCDSELQLLHEEAWFDQSCAGMKQLGCCNLSANERGHIKQNEKE